MVPFTDAWVESPSWDLEFPRAGGSNFGTAVSLSDDGNTLVVTEDLEVSTYSFDVSSLASTILEKTDVLFSSLAGTL